MVLRLAEQVVLPGFGHRLAEVGMHDEFLRNREERQPLLRRASSRRRDSRIGVQRPSRRPIHLPSVPCYPFRWRVFTVSLNRSHTGLMGLLERDSALEALTQYAAQARAGEGRVVLISGEAGAGKSALLEQLQRELVDVCWVGGTCDGLFTPRPLGPLFEIAEQLGGELLEACRSAVVPR